MPQNLLLEIEEILNRGWNAVDAVESATRKAAVFTYNAEWERTFFEEK